MTTDKLNVLGIEGLRRSPMSILPSLRMRQEATRREEKAGATSGIRVCGVRPSQCSRHGRPPHIQRIVPKQDVKDEEE